VATAVSFDLERAWRVDPRVSMRPEPFGALLYHFGTRRLSFLKNQTVLAVVRSLADHPSARGACLAAGVAEADLPVYARALAALADSKMISERTDPLFSAGSIGDQRDPQHQEKEDPLA
jgi:mycofactocin biosynthesis protein MftB